MWRLVCFSFIAAFALVGCSFVASVYVSPDGCTRDGACPYGQGQPRNFWWQAGREAVVQPGAGASIILHELCHGWQGRNLSLDDMSLDGWYDTPEANDFPQVPYRWRLGDSRLEDAAWTCTAYLLGWSLDDARLEWAEKWLH